MVVFDVVGVGDGVCVGVADLWDRDLVGSELDDVRLALGVGVKPDDKVLLWVVDGVGVPPQLVMITEGSAVLRSNGIQSYSIRPPPLPIRLICLH